MFKKQIITSVLMLLLFIIIGANNLKAQSDDGFIYGKITTWDNNTYKGAIRWGDEEVYWSDMFNSTKTSNENIKHLSRRERKLLDKHSNSINFLGFNFHKTKISMDDHEHVFVCQFGEIKTINMDRGERIKVEFKNGEMFDLKGGSNDIKTEINIFDEEIGKIELDWRKIEKVEFMKTPSKLKNKFGEPLYGIVDTHFGEFTGFIQWDHDERLSTDELDGENKDGDVEIKFGNIKSIEREGRKGCTVKLKSGRELYLEGSNGVKPGERIIAPTSRLCSIFSIQ